MEDDPKRNYLSKDDIAALPEAHVRHPFNTASDVYQRRLAPVFGLKRLALYITRIPPGKESFLYHRHEHDEEFLVILSGRGRAEIGEDIIEVGPGDIMGFPAPDGPAHHLTNPFAEDLVYLMGGESSDLDVAHFPREGKHLVFSQSGIWSFTDEQSERLTMADWMVPSDPGTG